MVGEIRDKETADLSIQAALTGHLVLSTLHTNNAATTLPRFLDMGAEPFLIASTVRVAVGQRLVRKLCPNCRQSYKPTEAEISKLKEQFPTDTALAELQKHAPPQDATTAETPSIQLQMLTTLEKFKDLTDYELWRAGAGCEVCDSTGYKGRLGIYEVLEVTDAIAKLIVSNATSDDLQSVGTKEGMITMQTDGFIKALAGLTSVEEVLRVTRE
ncbi:Flp pilus assembly complex ATPase component TadA, partial [Candidatus Microgenomates bacterium]|nr:Flp pilus assembly complex ATPase component TadA [Candidatus Microgenomates bacterium]